MIYFVDTNIFLDVILNRLDVILNGKRLIEKSKEVLNIGSLPGNKIITSAISFANITYFLDKYRRSEKQRLLLGLLDTIEIVNTPSDILRKAIQSNMPDLEDAYQYYTAIQEKKLECFVTRNIKHYKNKNTPILTPEEFVEIYTP